MFACARAVNSARPEHSLLPKNDVAALAHACDLARDLIRSDRGADATGAPMLRGVSSLETRGG